ncbi:hypothetical protein TRVA0_012S02212 [Trichomonascus vanleenenianus]|uniref:uncharacterized protein n=1 Tax=Trichomonascus vanleenenianus TaxID=2268995 RepID=UPI003ECA66D3
MNHILPNEMNVIFQRGGDFGHYVHVSADSFDEIGQVLDRSHFSIAQNLTVVPSSDATTNRTGFKIASFCRNVQRLTLVVRDGIDPWTEKLVHRIIPQLKEFTVAIESIESLEEDLELLRSATGLIYTNPLLDAIEQFDVANLGSLSLCDLETTQREFRTLLRKFNALTRLELVNVHVEQYDSDEPVDWLPRTVRELTLSGSFSESDAAVWSQRNGQYVSPKPTIYYNVETVKIHTVEGNILRQFIFPNAQFLYLLTTTKNTGLPSLRPFKLLRHLIVHGYPVSAIATALQDIRENQLSALFIESPTGDFKPYTSIFTHQSYLEFASLDASKLSFTTELQINLVKLFHRIEPQNLVVRVSRSLPSVPFGFEAVPDRFMVLDGINFGAFLSPDNRYLRGARTPPPKNPT